MPAKSESARERFCALMCDIFQFAESDLDFGMYRIMNQRRDRIDDFLNTGLPQAIAEHLSEQAQDETDSAAKQKSNLRAKIEKDFSKDAFDETGNLQKYHDTNLGKEWLAASEKTAGAQSSDELEAAVFNHLHEFFSRYYDEGDFLPKRRHGGNTGYSVRYGGEEILFHWANRGQYYIKTAERFQRYSFKADGITVRFEIRSAVNLPENNNKNGKQFYIPLIDEMRENNGVTALPFEYRPLNEKEKKKYGATKAQDKIMEDAEAALENAQTLSEKTKIALLKNHHTGKSSIAAYHIRRYVRRNTADFFIHKNLSGFLSDELDFYLKNEAVSAEDIDVGGAPALRQRIMIFRAARKIGGKIIDFLAQLENFQKRLWEKKKFITQAEYLVTAGNIADEKILQEISQSEKQWEEWRNLLSIDSEQNDIFTAKSDKENKRLAFIKSHPSLPVDTANFGEDFKDALLSHLSDSGDLDEMCDGVLIHSENFQALNLLSEKYRGRVKCVHIDPPYNTETSGFLYKNNYKHSSWLSMMENGMILAFPLLSDNGVFLCHIDENEYESLNMLCNTIFPWTLSGTIIWDKRNPVSGANSIATQHEYIICRTAQAIKMVRPKTNGQAILNYASSCLKKYEDINDARKDFKKWVKKQKLFSVSERMYSEIDDGGRVFRTVHMGAPEQRIDPKFHKPLIHPVTKKPCPVPPSGYSSTPEFIQNLLEQGEIIFGKDETTQPQRKYFLENTLIEPMSSLLPFGKKGKTEMDSMGLAFSYCHHSDLYSFLLSMPEVQHKEEIILDYFAGSGTTAHAVINLNREDGGKRKFILVEMGEYFDSVLLLRIKKITYASEWKDGNPKHSASELEAKRGPRLVKYLRLESYDDAMDNIGLESPDSLLAKDEEYFIKYALNYESRNNATFLPGAIKSPFDCKLHKAESGCGELAADLPETFNYLIGLYVKSRRVFREGKRRYLVYRGIADGVDVAVIWRDTKGWESSDRKKDCDIIERNKFTDGAQRIYVNDDSLVKGAESLDPIFKSAMFAMSEEK